MRQTTEHKSVEHSRGRTAPIGCVVDVSEVFNLLPGRGHGMIEYQPREAFLTIRRSPGALIRLRAGAGYYPPSLSWG